MDAFNRMGTLGRGAVVLLVLAVIAGGFWYSSTMPQTEEQVFCTADAMQCPDGSYVGRSGPNCEFVCPAATTTPPTGGGGGILPYNSGIRGTVMAGPTCPVVQNPPQGECDDKPIATTITVMRSSSTAVLLQTRSTESGAFEFALPPGDYVVSGGEAVLPRCSETQVTVRADTYSRITLNCDTGIR